MNTQRLASWRRVRHATRILISGLVATAILGVPISVAAAQPTQTCIVWAKGTHAIYRTVQAALDASAAGVTLLVRGTCSGPTVVSKDATIRAASDQGHERATLDGASAGSVLTVNEGVTLQLDRLIITHGYFHGPGGGGILNLGTLIMKRSTVTENTGRDGGGIANFGDATILASTIDHNGTYRGGNVYNAGTLLLKDSMITRGGGRWGQGLWNSVGATATLVRTSVTDNIEDFVPFSGGGIENHGDLTLIDSDVTRNVSLYGGGILNDGTAHLIRSRVTNNVTQTGGGGIQNGPAFSPGSGSEQLVLTGSEISGNSSQFGGGIYNKGVVTLHGRTRIGGNTAAAVGQGGGIYNDPGATVTGLRHRTFRPANIPDQCVGCTP